MKKFLVIMTVAFSSLAFADDPFPYDSRCRSYGASSETVTLQSDANRKIVLCRFGISSYLDKDSVRYSPFGSGSAVVRAYQQNDNVGIGQSCGFMGGFIERAYSQANRIFHLCTFFDGSAMEEMTFQNGPQDLFNREMNQALGIN